MATDISTASSVHSAEETAYISRYTLACDPAELQPFLINLIPEQVIKLLTTQFYNHQVMQAIMCIILAIVWKSTSSIPDGTRIHKWFGLPKLIGNESAEGYAFNTKLDQKANTIILKTLRRQSQGDLYHEVFIGLYGTNPLRSILPNFAYILGLFPCSAPVIKNKQLVSYCQNDAKKKSTYIMYENITPALSLADFLPSANTNTVLIILLQLYLSLRIAWLTKKFVHNDLHAENVLIRDLGSIHTIPYPLSSTKTIYLQSRYLATIIDYGYSHILHNGEHFGINGGERFGVFNDIPLPISDAFRITISTLMFMSNTVFNELWQIGRFFYPSARNASQLRQMIATDLQNKRVYYLMLPSEAQQKRFIDYARTRRGNVPQTYVDTLNFNYDNLINLVLNSYGSARNISYRYNSTYPLLSCGTCLTPTVNQVFKSTFSSFNPLQLTPTNFYQFYDLYTNRELTDYEKNKLEDNFSNIYMQARNDYLNQLRLIQGSDLDTYVKMGKFIATKFDDLTLYHALQRFYK